MIKLNQEVEDKVPIFSNIIININILTEGNLTKVITMELNQGNLGVQINKNKGHIVGKDKGSNKEFCSQTAKYQGQ